MKFHSDRLYSCRFLLLSIQLTVEYRNGLLGQAVIRCVSQAYEHVEDSVTIHTLDVVGMTVVVFLLSKKNSAWSAQVSHANHTLDIP